MRTTPAKDLRVTKTLEAIDRTFRAMMLQGGYGSITVKALCERARINKKTFYRYYETLDDLLAEVMSAYASAWRERTVHLGGASDFAQMTRELFYFGAEQDELYDVITCDPAWDGIRRQLQDDASGEHAENVPAGFTPELWHLLYAYVSQAGLAMYRAWVADGKAIPLPRAAETAARLVCQGSDALTLESSGASGRK
ncbi:MULTISPECIES: TetR/AcrR family transcriptional regulator [unclassified Actinomyces]|uniref:TetR/AcrR family transcriptional regulator n=1 Tax=unclassified Actinomyces TaxID=2609248 RepID=UPI000D58FFF4|nr:MULTISPECIES: TetR/AcrR family transcriptional regulator [unclassified Actinomyces]RAX20030.1 TetR/AcrR family transcriptional regulator [Actinomyces sp. Z5]RAX22499.1 TetR/AcrR family transcriptional regulator [Actinomyces sp. Z3]